VLEHAEDEEYLSVEDEEYLSVEDALLDTSFYSNMSSYSWLFFTATEYKFVALRGFISRIAKEGKVCGGEDSVDSEGLHSDYDGLVCVVVSQNLAVDIESTDIVLLYDTYSNQWPGDHGPLWFEPLDVIVLTTRRRWVKLGKLRVLLENHEFPSLTFTPVTGEESSVSTAVIPTHPLPLLACSSTSTPRVVSDASRLHTLSCQFPGDILLQNCLPRSMPLELVHVIAEFIGTPFAGVFPNCLTMTGKIHYSTDTMYNYRYCNYSIDVSMKLHRDLLLDVTVSSAGTSGNEYSDLTFRREYSANFQLGNSPTKLKYDKVRSFHSTTSRI